MGNSISFFLIFFSFTFWFSFSMRSFCLSGSEVNVFFVGYCLHTPPMNVIMNVDIMKQCRIYG